MGGGRKPNIHCKSCKGQDQQNCVTLGEAGGGAGLCWKQSRDQEIWAAMAESDLSLCERWGWSGKSGNLVENLYWSWSEKDNYTFLGENIRTGLKLPETEVAKVLSQTPSCLNFNFYWLKENLYIQQIKLLISSLCHQRVKNSHVHVPTPSTIPGMFRSFWSALDFWITSCDFNLLEMLWRILEEEKKGVETLPRKLLLPVSLQWFGAVLLVELSERKMEMTHQQRGNSVKICEFGWSAEFTGVFWRWIINCCTKEMMWTLENVSPEPPAGKVQLFCAFVTPFFWSWRWLMWRVALEGTAQPQWGSAGIADSSIHSWCAFSFSASGETCGCRGN